MKGKRTDIDFSEHIIIETKQEGFSVHDFRIPDTSSERILFINTNGIMAITGDFGNYIFCREFHPSPKDFVSDFYWCEKLQINSLQEYADYSPSDTEEELKIRLKEYIEEQKIEDENFHEEEDFYDEQNETIKYYKECIEKVHNEHEYIAFAYHERPDNIDCEDVVFRKEIKHRLKIIFDAFDEICRRLKEEENSKLENN